MLPMSRHCIVAGDEHFLVATALRVISEDVCYLPTATSWHRSAEFYSTVGRNKKTLSHRQETLHQV